MPANQMRTWIEILVQCSQDPDLRQLLIDQHRVRADYTASATTGPGPGQFTLPPAASDFPVPFGGVTKASVVMIVSFDDIKYKIDSPSAPLKKLYTIPADTTGNPLSAEEKLKQPGLMVICGTDITALYLTNPDTINSAGVYVGLIGEAS